MTACTQHHFVSDRRFLSSTCYCGHLHTLIHLRETPERNRCLGEITKIRRSTSRDDIDSVLLHTVITTDVEKRLMRSIDQLAPMGNYVRHMTGRADFAWEPSQIRSARGRDPKTQVGSAPPTHWGYSHFVSSRPRNSRCYLDDASSRSDSLRMSHVYASIEQTEV